MSSCLISSAIKICPSGERLLLPLALKFSDTPFDYLYYIDQELNPLVLHLLAVSKAHCRIGRFAEPDSAFFEMMIEHKGPVKGLIDSMYKYTRQLK